MSTEVKETRHPTPVATFRAYETPDAHVGLDCVYVSMPCGCKIIGNGTCPHPLDIKYCPEHAAAPDLLTACEAWIAYCVTDPSRADVGEAAMNQMIAAVAKAKGE